MAHIDDLYEAQAKQLLHKLCDALGIEQANRTKAEVEKAIAGVEKVFGCRGVNGILERSSDDEEAEIDDARGEFGDYVQEEGGRN